MNKELLEILLQFYSEKPESQKSTCICQELYNRRSKYICSGIECHNCLVGRSTHFAHRNIHKNLDQIQITLKVITDEP